MSAKKPNLRIQDIGEFALIETLFGSARLNARGLGVGDDCALIPKNQNSFYALTTDAFIEGTHFLTNQHPKDLGHKALAANLSDLAAKGAAPRFALISWELPAQLSLGWLRDFMSGFEALAKKHSLKVVGGNTSAGQKISIHITLIGEIKKNRIKLRSGAKSGQYICCTGFLGEAAAGFFSLTKNHHHSIEKKHFIRPDRVLTGQWLSQQKAVGATMDISDGLVGDLEKILAASNCKALINAEALPISKMSRQYAKRFTIKDIQLQRWALSGGEDYELLFTVDATRFDEFCNRYQKATNTDLHVLGRVMPGQSELFRQEPRLIRSLNKVIPWPAKVIHVLERDIPEADSLMRLSSSLMLCGPKRTLQELSKKPLAGFDHFDSKL